MNIADYKFKSPKKDRLQKFQMRNEQKYLNEYLLFTRRSKFGNCQIGLSKLILPKMANKILPVISNTSVAFMVTLFSTRIDLSILLTNDTDFAVEKC